MRNESRKRIILVFFTFLLVILCGGILSKQFLYDYLDKFNKNSTANYREPIEGIGKDDDVNILVLGIDIGNAGAENETNNGRTDTMLVVNYKPKTEETNIISIPRDTLIKIKGKNEKINAAHVYGGVNYAVESIENMLGLKINYYGKIDYAGFRAVIDAIGGVDIKITRNMYYDDPTQNLHIHFKKGNTVHLDGEKAEEFFRWRKNNDGTGLADGDLGRIENQHIFIEKVVDKFKNPSIIPRIPAILKVLPKYVDTNMEPNDILKYGTVLAKIDKDKLKLCTIQGDLVDIDGISYLVYNESKNKDILVLLNDKE